MISKSINQSDYVTERDGLTILIWAQKIVLGLQEHFYKRIGNKIKYNYVILEMYVYVYVLNNIIACSRVLFYSF